MSELFTIAKSGAASTALLAQLRWRMIRVPGIRTAIISAAFFFVLATAIIANFGFALTSVAQDPTSPGNVFALDLLSQLADGRLEGVVSLTLISLLSIAVFGPFTGTGTVSLASAEDLYGIRPSKAHRYFDSLSVNAASGLGILQLLGLIGLHSFLTLDAHRLPGILLAFSVWAVLITLMSTIAWTIEWVVRRFGRWQRYLFGAALLGVGAIFYFFNPDSATTLYGAGNWYVNLLRGPESPALLPWAIATTIVAATALILFGLRVFLAADKHLPPALLTSKPGRYRHFSGIPLLMALRLTVVTVMRTPQTRRPMIAAVIFGAPAVMVIDMDQLLAGSLSFAIPLAVALSWPANVFALVGTGMPWLASQPKIMAVFPKAAMAAQFLLTMAVISVLSGMALLAGRATVEDVQEILLQASFITIAAAGVAALLSVMNPIRAQMTSRGDALVPPVTALIYMVVLLIFTAIPGFAFGGILAAGQWGEVVAVLFSGLIGIGCGLLAISRWRNPQVRARAVSTVGAE